MNLYASVYNTLLEWCKIYLIYNESFHCYLLLIYVLLANCETITNGDLYIEQLRETSFAFRQWYFQVAKLYGPIVWKWELTGFILVIELLQLY